MPGDSFDEEIYKVVVWRDKATGKIVNERWFDEEGRFHRTGGPAKISRNAQTDVVTVEWWYQHGKEHRDGEPAVINRDAKTGEVRSTIWFRDGVKIPKPKRSDPQHSKPRPKAHP